MAWLLAAIGVSLLGLWLLDRLANFSLVEREEVQRTTCPAGDLDAIVQRWDGGATSSGGHSVYLVASGGAWQSGIAVADVRGLDAVTCRWSGPDALRVECDDLQRARLEHAVVPFAGREVRVSLVPAR